MCKPPHLCFVWLMVGLLLALAGCQVRAIEEPAGTPPPASSATPVRGEPRSTTSPPTETAAPAATRAEVGLAAAFPPLPAAITTYQLVLQLDFLGTQDGQTVTQSVTLVDDIDRKQGAERLTMTSLSSFSPLPEELALIRIGTQTWLQYGSDWSSGDASTPARAPALNLMPLLEQITRWQFVDDTTVIEGIPVNHYRVTQAYLLDEGQALGQIQDAHGEIWTAQDGGYVLQMLLTVTGGPLLQPDQGTLQGKTMLAYSVHNLNLPLEITAP
jgi:hypothetical protein